MIPQKALDPYEMNTITGTRMPMYSNVSKERDLYGELGWIPNFQVTLSKNNPKMHRTYKEYFDIPKSYHAIHNSNATASEFFRQQAPFDSVAKQKRIRSSR